MLPCTANDHTALHQRPSTPLPFTAITIRRTSSKPVNAPRSRPPYGAAPAPQQRLDVCVLASPPCVTVSVHAWHAAYHTLRRRHAYAGNTHRRVQVTCPGPYELDKCMRGPCSYVEHTVHCMATRKVLKSVIQRKLTNLIKPACCRSASVEAMHARRAAAARGGLAAWDKDAERQPTMRMPTPPQTSRSGMSRRPLSPTARTRWNPKYE